MKKMTAIVSAVLAAAMLAAPMSAFAADDSVTTIKPIGVVDDKPFDVNPTPDKANTTVEFNIDPAYTVTIPAKVTLTGEYGKTYSGSGEISTDKVFLGEGKKIVVSLTSASEFNLKTADAKDYKLPYTASGEKGELKDKKKGGVVAEFTTNKERESRIVSFRTDETPTYAGKYTDPVVFTIEVKDSLPN